MATTSKTINEKHEQTIADYVGELAVLEADIVEALDRQLTQLQDDPATQAAVQGFHDTVKAHRDTLRQLQAETGSTAGNPLKNAGAALLGKAAEVVNLGRTEGNANALRDDYASFSRAAISYAMLYTAAGSSENQGVAALAEKHLRDLAAVMKQINQLMPGVLARELAAEDDPREVVDPAIAEGLQALDEAQDSLLGELRTGDITQDAYDEAWTSLIEKTPPAVLKASMAERQDVSPTALDQTPDAAKV